MASFIPMPRPYHYSVSFSSSKSRSAIAAHPQRNIPARPAEFTRPVGRAARQRHSSLPMESCACAVSLRGVIATSIMNLAAKN